MDSDPGILFGDFTSTEVCDLYSGVSGGLKFVWQEGSPNKEAAAPPPPRLLELPLSLPPPSYGSGTTSPVMPPNPPTSPEPGGGGEEEEEEEGGASGNQSKLNINAPIFVPKNVSTATEKAVKNSGGRKTETKLVPHSDSSKASPQGTPTRGHHGNASLLPGGVMDSNNRHAKEGMERVTSRSPEAPTAAKTQRAALPPSPRSPPPPSPSLTPPPRSARSPSSTSEIKVQKGQSPTSHPVAGAGSESVIFHSPDPHVSRTARETLLLPCAPVDTVSTTPTSSLDLPRIVTDHTLLTGHTTSPLTSRSPSPSPSPAPPTHTGVPPRKSWASIVSLGVTPSPHTPSPLTPSQAGGRTPGAAPDSGGLRVGGVKEGEGVGGESGDTTRELRSLGEQLAGLSISHEVIDVLPRGLINSANWCYIHAPLQALLCCPPLFNLLHSLSPFPSLSREPSATPLTDSIVQFVHEFKSHPKPHPSLEATPISKSAKRRRSNRMEFVCGDPFRPDYVYQTLTHVKPQLSHKGRQEDAEELLGCLLDGLHEEMAAARRSNQEGGEEEGEEVREEEVEEEEEEKEAVGGEEEWERVGPKNKSTVTRQTSFSESPITEIFGGEVRSVLQRHGSKESATVEPFFSLQLDIQSEQVHSVRGALEALVVKEMVQMNSGTKEEIQAHRKLSLAHLPPVLVLHLKRFVFYKTGGCQKVLKQIEYNTELEIGKELLAPSVKQKLSPPQRSYKLWAVVYHHGKTASGGHYTCDVFLPSCGGWVRTDDQTLRPVSKEQVVKHSVVGHKVAYLLLYRRADTV